MATPSLPQRWMQAVVRKAAGFAFPNYGVMASWLFGPSRTQYNYALDVREGLLSSVVMPTIQWLMRAFPEAPLVVRRRQADELEIVDGHPLVQLVERPNDFYPGALLWMATIRDWAWVGESYWRILVDRGGRPGQLWWLPPWSIDPKWPQDGSVYISHYDYHPDTSTTIRLEREEVIHFRHGLDPMNPRHGLPPLRALMQDIWVDQESNNFIGAMLRNMGVPGMVLSPKGDANLSQDDVERIKAYITSRFTGDGRGEPLAFGAPTDVQKLSFSPTELDLSTWRIGAETRVPAALGIPSAVIGFYSGLDATKVGSTMREYVRLAWSNGIIPVQRLMAAELQRVLLAQFELDPDQFLIGWNYDEVAALEEDQNELAKRAVAMYQGGVLMRSEARQLMGYEPNNGDEIYLVPSSMTEEGPDAPEPEPVPLPTLPAAGTNGNGNGNGQPQPLQQRSYGLKQGSLEELVMSIIGRQAGRMNNPPRAMLRAATRMYREEQKLQPQLQAMILPVLERYGNMAAVAAREILIPQKQSLEDIISTSIIHERLPIVAVKAELGAVYAEMYALMAEMTLKVLQDELQLEPTNTARIEAHLSMAARERVGLLDLSTEARTSILKSLEDARAQGLDETQMVDLIRQRVPSGRWTSPEVRAQIIARSESRFASNLASSAAARDLGARILILDARLGPSDEICEARNGMVVSPAQAEALAGVEHVNGTMMSLVLSPTAVTGSPSGSTTGVL